MTLRVTKQLNITCFDLFEGPAGVKNKLICMDLSIKNMLERLVLKSPIQQTSQRVKRTSVARVMV